MKVRFVCIKGRVKRLKQIEEVIVVEGKSDTIAIQRAVGADTIETNGSAIDEETLARIAHAAERRGVIVFTDPDYPGRRIRAIIEEHIPEAKHAFLTKEETQSPRKGSLGIEHASDEAIREALRHVYTVSTDDTPLIPKSYLVERGLIGLPGANEKRQRVAQLLKIGQVNGKTLQKRLQMFRITKEALDRAIEEGEQS